MMANRHLAHHNVEEDHEGGLMPVFSVGVRRKSSFLTAFSRAQRAYVVEADTAKKAENAGKHDVCDSLGRHPG
jgi:hypothetical protein